MSDTVIQVDRLWKKYRLGVLGTGTLRHDFNRWLHRTLGKPDPYAKVGETQRAEILKTETLKSAETSKSQLSASQHFSVSDFSVCPPSLREDEIWALRDISFEVKQGEILGIIGRNGAGKSTLLKILSRVTAPTHGEVRVKGRIASLLEVGTGFHPELTGRENIFLNGAILGMTKAEIRNKLDEIVSFAEVEQFIDTPVKRYSSGMYVRLAFAVAAHLEPEILIVDEVLAVGDAAFQKKCLTKMGDAARGGRTVLFVSHSMPAAQNLCRVGLLLAEGSLHFLGEIESAIARYLLSATAKVTRSASSLSKHIEYAELRLPTDREHLMSSDSLMLRVRVNTHGQRIYPPCLGIGISDQYGRRLLTVTNRLENYDVPLLCGRAEFNVSIQPPNLTPGTYTVKLAFGSSKEDIDVVEDALQFEIYSGDFYGSGRLPDAAQGVLLARSSWEYRPL